MNKKKWRMLGLLGAVLFVGLVAVFLATQDREPNNRQKIPEEERSLAHQLAIYDAGKYVPPDYETVPEFGKLLAELESTTSSSREEIKNLSIDGVVELEENFDVEVTLLEFMRQADEIASEADPNLGYEDITSKVQVILSQEKSEA